MIVEEIQGNILDTTVDVIAHGVNCQGAMGSGVAKVLYTKWPEIKKEYHKRYDRKLEAGWKPKDFLGYVNIAHTNDNKEILNCYTQLKYGYDGKKYISYDALYDVFSAISKKYKEVAIPKIGCGLAGGDWEIVKAIINSATGNHCKVYVYYL